MKIVTWNVAGLRACEKKGFLDFIKEYSPDVLCLQETKANVDQLSDQLVFPEGYQAVYASAQKKGYSGVSTWIKKGLTHQTQVGVGDAQYDDEGRTLITEFDSFILINGYFPNGQRDHGRVPYKLAYSRTVASLAMKLEKSKKKPVWICGDFNTAHHPIDLANPKANINSTGFLPIEREWMDEFSAQGFVDIFRHYHPDEVGAYTWWTFRNDCRARNIGWRLDYFWGSSEAVKLAKDCEILASVPGSDHCPVLLKLK